MKNYSNRVPIYGMFAEICIILLACIIIPACATNPTVEKPAETPRKPIKHYPNIIDNLDKPMLANAEMRDSRKGGRDAN